MCGQCSLHLLAWQWCSLLHGVVIDAVHTPLPRPLSSSSHHHPSVVYTGWKCCLSWSWQSIIQARGRLFRNVPTRARDSFPNAPTRARDSFPNAPTLARDSFPNAPTRARDSFPNAPTLLCNSFSNIPIHSDSVSNQPRACDQNSRSDEWGNELIGVHCVRSIKAKPNTLKMILSCSPVYIKKHLSSGKITCRKDRSLH